jgi:predicted chitinase
VCAPVATDFRLRSLPTVPLSPLADSNDVRAITRRVNGGLNGLDERIELLGPLSA